MGIIAKYFVKHMRNVLSDDTDAALCDEIIIDACAFRVFNPKYNSGMPINLRHGVPVYTNAAYDNILADLNR